MPFVMAMNGSMFQCERVRAHLACRVRKAFESFLEPCLDEEMRACRNADVIVVSQTKAVHGSILAEYYGVPVIGVFIGLFGALTGDFPMFFITSNFHLPRFVNKLCHVLAFALISGSLWGQSMLVVTSFSCR